MKVGFAVIVQMWGPDSVRYERARVCRAPKYMRPIPSGFVPVRFAIDGTVLLAHPSQIVNERAPA